ncbi:hypothetical protein PR048_006367 [Dryococelus australis]|uniref:DDE-1 domain-containing protein n=1 Tax=Dryococelus australis TaxID=614101 RepID=A0ABQ9IBG0_9NEOP|nr:hypothetical protein PR048_006367 [Dryococelus australis]
MPTVCLLVLQAAHLLLLPVDVVGEWRVGREKKLAVSLRPLSTVSASTVAPPSKECPVLLIVDDHSSHISLAAVNFCRENGIVLVSLPLHCSYKLQPLDIGFFGPLKMFYNTACENWMFTNPVGAVSPEQPRPSTLTEELNDSTSRAGPLSPKSSRIPTKTVEAVSLEQLRPFSRSSRGEIKKRHEQSKKIKKKPASKYSSIACPECPGMYENLSAEVLVQCYGCTIWNHESCTDNRGKGLRKVGSNDERTVVCGWQGWEHAVAAPGSQLQTELCSNYVSGGRCHRQMLPARTPSRLITRVNVTNAVGGLADNSSPAAVCSLQSSRCGIVVVHSSATTWDLVALAVSHPGPLCSIPSEFDSEFSRVGRESNGFLTSPGFMLYSLAGDSLQTNLYPNSKLTPMPYPGFEPRASRTPDRWRTNRLRYGRSELPARASFFAVPVLMWGGKTAPMGQARPRFHLHCQQVPGITPAARLHKARQKCRLLEAIVPDRPSRHNGFTSLPEMVSLLASNQGDPGSIPGRVTPDFRMWESCRIMPFVGGFSRGSPISPLFHSGADSYSLQ